MHRNMFLENSHVVFGLNCFYLYKWSSCKLAVKLCSLPLQTKLYLPPGDKIKPAPPLPTLLMPQEV